MPPKPCPKRLQRLIDDDPHVLRQILQAIKAKRQNKGPDTFAVESPSRVTMNLINYKVTEHSELAVTLREINPRNFDLIRDCRKCNRLFWAGRVDKTLCDKDAAQWRKAKQRRKQQAEKATVGKQAAELHHAQQKEEAVKRLSPTAVAILNAIVIKGHRIFWDIDHQVWSDLKDDPLVRKVSNPYVVRRTITMLVNRGFLRHFERAGQPHKDRYEPRQKLADLW